MGMKLLSHLMKLLHLMTLPSQQFCLCGTLFNVHDTLMKYALRPQKIGLATGKGRIWFLKEVFNFPTSCIFQNFGFLPSAVLGFSYKLEHSCVGRVSIIRGALLWWFRSIKKHSRPWISDISVCTTGNEPTWTLLVQQCGNAHFLLKGVCSNASHILGARQGIAATSYSYNFPLMPAFLFWN